jgi:chromosomal replication initiation ATPase DnaA
MSFVQSLHQAHKARLTRMATVTAKAGLHIAKRDPAPRYVLDANYERAWAAALLGDGERPPPQPRVAEIQRATAHDFRITLTDLLSARRTHDVIRPRQVAMYLAKRFTRKSFPAIARLFGDRDHTTVLHAVRKIEQRLATDAELAASVARISQALDHPEHLA